jgi:integrase
MLADQVDPSARKKAERLAEADTFEAIAREWLALQKRGLSEKTFLRKLGWLEDFLFPYLGRHPIAKITAPELLAALKRIEARGFRETAHRARSTASNVLCYAVATGRAERDISTDLRGALAPVVTTNRAAITVPVQIGQLMRTIYAYRAQRTTESALKLAPLLFVRPTELRAAECLCTRRPGAPVLGYRRVKLNMLAARIARFESHCSTQENLELPRERRFY